MLRSLALLLALAGLVAGVGACLDPPPGEVKFAEDFEGCGLCRWQASGGLSIVETNHPAEHAVQFGNGGILQQWITVTRPSTVDNAYGAALEDGPWLEYSTTCPATPTVSLSVIYPPDGTTGLGILLDLPSGATPPPDSPMVFTRIHANLPPPLLEWDGWSFRQITINAGGGDCVVDNLRLMIAQPDYGY